MFGHSILFIRKDYPSFGNANKTNNTLHYYKLCSSNCDLTDKYSALG